MTEVDRIRKAGYYLRQNDHIFMATNILNMNEQPQKVFLSMEFEYLDGIPEDFDIVFPIWLDVKGNCLSHPLPPKEARVFTARGPATGWTTPWAGELILAVSHIHDGNTRQDIFLDDEALVCSSVPSYGESDEFISSSGATTNNTTAGDHDHDHDDERNKEKKHYHVSSIMQCHNITRVTRGQKFTITSQYNMEKHQPLKDHEGKEEPIMAIQFLHFVRPREEAIRDILASKPGNLTAFSEQVTNNGVGGGIIVVPRSH